MFSIGSTLLMFYEKKAGHANTNSSFLRKLQLDFFTEKVKYSWT
jgi:hypothetical protein